LQDDDLEDDRMLGYLLLLLGASASAYTPPQP
jgi:hypothetical protein